MALLDGFPIRELTGLLCDNDADDSRQSYERLSFGVGTSFKDDGAENEVGKVDIQLCLDCTKPIIEADHVPEISLLTN